MPAARTYLLSGSVFVVIIRGRAHRTNNCFVRVVECVRCGVPQQVPNELRVGHCHRMCFTQTTSICSVLAHAAAAAQIVPKKDWRQTTRAQK